MSLTLEEEELTMDILYNLPLLEIATAIAKLSPEARSVLKEDCQLLAARLARIAEQV